MKRITYSLWLGSLFLLSCQEKKEVFVSFSNPELDYSGRVNFDNKEGAEFYWTGTSIKMNVPCLTLRDNTERLETIDLGTNELVGTNPQNLKPILISFLIANGNKHKLYHFGTEIQPNA